MVRHYFTSAVRGIVRKPVSAAIKLLALSLGLASFLLAHLVTDHVLQTDAHWAGAGRIYTLSQAAETAGGDVIYGTAGAISGPAVEYLKVDFPDIPIAATQTMNISAKAQGRTADTGNQLSVDPEFIEVFDLAMVHGAAERLADAPGGALMRRDLALELFGRTDVIGEEVLLQNDLAVTVVGVFAFPDPTHLGAEATGKDVRVIITRETASAQYAQTMPDGTVVNQPMTSPYWEYTCCTTYALLPADGSMTRADFDARLAEFAERRVPPENGAITFRATSLTEIANTYMNTRVFGGGLSLSLPVVLLVFAALVLLVACLDFANLATAEASTRAKEIGLRKTVGARRGQIAAQTLVEAGLLTAGALILVLPITLLLAAPLGRMLNLEFGLPGLSRPAYWLSVLAVAAAVCLAAGAYPALVLARIRPIFALRMSGAQGGSRAVRTVLIGVQFAAASFLLVAIAVMMMQKAELRGRLTDPADDPRLTIALPNGAQGQGLAPLMTELRRHPAVTGVAASSSQPFRRSPYSQRGGGPEFARSEDPGALRIPGQFRTVSPGYFDVAGISIVAGEEVAAGDWPRISGFLAVIDVETAAGLGFAPQEAVGQDIYFLQPAPPGSQVSPVVPFRVIGVAENAPLEYMTGGASNFVYIIQEQVGAGAVIVRIARGDVAGALAHIDGSWADLFPDRTINRAFLDEAFDTSFAMFDMMNLAFVALSVIAIVIAAVGMFGIARFMVARRLREIGVRKTLGASSGRVMARLVWDFSKPVLIANLIAWPFAFLAARVYLNFFVTRIDLTPLPFLAALALTLAMAWLAVGAQAWGAARVKPANVLKYE